MGFRLILSHKFVEANCHRLSQVHCAVFFASGNSKQPLTMAHLLIRESRFFGAEETSHISGDEMLSYDPRRLCQGFEWMLKLTVACGSRSHHQSAICHRVRHTVILACLREKERSSDRRSCFSKAGLVWPHEAQAREPEIA